MNSFRSAILSGKGLHSGDPIVRQKKKRGAAEDDLSTVAVPRSEKRIAQPSRRRPPPAGAGDVPRARFEGEVHEVDVINLSGGGAMIRCDFTPRLWERVDLIFAEGAEIECAVRWIRDDRVGLEFAHETRIDCDPEGARCAAARRHPSQFPGRRPVDSRRIGSPTAAQCRSSDDDDDAIANSRRTERRHPLVWMGEVYFAHNNEKVRLRNISEHGALIESPVQYPLGRGTTARPG